MSPFETSVPDRVRQLFDLIRNHQDEQYEIIEIINSFTPRQLVLIDEAVVGSEISNSYESFRSLAKEYLANMNSNSSNIEVQESDEDIVHVDFDQEDFDEPEKYENIFDQNSFDSSASDYSFELTDFDKSVEYNLTLEEIRNILNENEN